MPVAMPAEVTVVTMKTAIGLVSTLSALGACESTSPDPLPSDRFGRITALVRGDFWISDFRSDSVVATYDPVTGRLKIVGIQSDYLGPSSSLSMEVCGSPAARTYAFANTWNGPYGPDRLALGAAADWSQRAEILGMTELGVMSTAISFGSTGEPGDSLYVEQLDLGQLLTRGSFRFHARSAGGTYAMSIRGRFSGRIALGPGQCSLEN